MKKTKIIINVIFFTVVLLYCQTARADDAIRVYFELSKDTTTLWPTEHWPSYERKDYLRGRVIFLDKNNEVADSFAGKPITNSDLILESVNYGSEVLFSTRPSTS